jgi:hypothetical protein
MKFTVNGLRTLRTFRYDDALSFIYNYVGQGDPPVLNGKFICGTCVETIHRIIWRKYMLDEALEDLFGKKVSIVIVIFPLEKKEVG